MMNFYSPNNFKNGRLIFNRYRMKDLLIFAIALIISILSIIITLNVFRIFHPILLFVEILPAVITFFLIQSLGIYHNFMLYFLCFFSYIERQKNYIWEGVYKYEIEKEQSKKEA